MFNLFSKSRLTALLALFSVSAMNSSLIASEYYDSSQCCDTTQCCDSSESGRMYIGVFGGELFSNSTKISQLGTAFFTEAQGGPLAVIALGHTKKTSSGYGGVQVGYELSRSSFCGCSDWTLAPAAEIEAFFYSHNKKGHLFNPSDRLPEHDFVDSFRMNKSVLLVNAVFSLNNSCWSAFSPYIGGGIGAVHISLKDAKSFQVDPIEAGINHFNSRRCDSTWAFAAQAKVGLRYNICQSLHIFGEYRYLYVDSSNYILGSTVYPDHAPTSPWNIKVNNIHYNAFAVGLQYDL